MVFEWWGPTLREVDDAETAEEGMVSGEAMAGEAMLAARDRDLLRACAQALRGEEAAKLARMQQTVNMDQDRILSKNLSSTRFLSTTAVVPSFSWGLLFFARWGLCDCVRAAVRKHH